MNVFTAANRFNATPVNRAASRSFLAFKSSLTLLFVGLLLLLSAPAYSASLGSAPPPPTPPAAPAPPAAAGPPTLLGPASAFDVSRFNQSVQLPEAALVRQQPVSVNRSNLSPSTGTLPSQISVDLFGEQLITLVLNRIEIQRAGNYTWHGKILGYPKGRATLT